MSLISSYFFVNSHCSNRYDRDEDCILEALCADERDHVWQGVAASQVATFLVIIQTIEMIVCVILLPSVICLYKTLHVEMLIPRRRFRD